MFSYAANVDMLYFPEVYTYIPEFPNVHTNTSSLLYGDYDNNFCYGMGENDKLAFNFMIVNSLPFFYTKDASMHIIRFTSLNNYARIDTVIKKLDEQKYTSFELQQINTIKLINSV